MKAKFFLIAICSALLSITIVSAQSASNFSNPGVEYKKAPYTLKTKKHDRITHSNRFNSHKKANGNCNLHPYVSKGKRNGQHQPILNRNKAFGNQPHNKKHKHKDHGDKAPRSW